MSVSEQRIALVDQAAEHSRDALSGVDRAKSFFEYLAVTDQRRLKWVLLVGFFVHMSYAIIDWLTNPDLFWFFFALRSTSSTFVMASFIYIRRPKPYRVLLVISAIGALSFGGAVSVMIHNSGGHQSSYYGGLPLVMIVPGLLLTWPISLSISIQIILSASFIAPVIIFESGINWPLLFTNSSFVVTTGLFSVIGSHLRYKLAFEEFTQRTKLDISLQQLSDANRLREQMFQNVSHELRTPLTLILAPLDAVQGSQSEHLSPWARKKLEIASRSALRLLNLVNDFLELASIDHEGVPVRRENVDLLPLTQALVDDLQGIASQKRISISIIRKALHTIFIVDRKHLEKILMNLVSNALKFTPEGGSIELILEKQDGGLAIRIRDSGIGMTADAIPKIFERFQQADGTTKRKFGGTGIGLHLVKQLATRMEMGLDVISEPGKGSIFSLLIPAKLKAENKSADPEMSTELALYHRAALAAIDSGGSAEIALNPSSRHFPLALIAEDDSEIAAEIAEILQARFRVIHVADGLTALEKTVQQSPHLVVSDVMMPGIDGIELCRAIRERVQLKDTAIILLSAKGSISDRVRGREVGADTYLTKPFHPDELLAAALGLLRSRMRLVGNFLVERELGAGGQARVFCARSISTGRLVALKVIQQGTELDASVKERLRSEQTALSKLTHPNIVRGLESGVDGAAFFIAMEFLDGTNVHQLLQERALTIAQAVTMIRAAADAVAAVHASGLLHRDIKPSNLMVLRGTAPLRSRTRVIDFGTVVGRSDVSNPHWLIGTLPFISPEQIQGGAPSAAGDVYALGVTLYYLLTRRSPWSATAPMAVRDQIVMGDWKPIAAINPEVDSRISQVVETAMAGSLHIRYPTAESLLAALESLSIKDVQAELTLLKEEEEPSAAISALSAVQSYEADRAAR